MIRRAALCLLVLCPPAMAEMPDADAEFATFDPDQVRLGHLLFYDPILSGNREVSCATCHHPNHATADGVALGLGDGGIGLGPNRRVDAKNLPEQRIPRNSPALFNLGAAEFTTFFHDGRLQADPTRPSGLRTPLEGDMVSGFASALSAQSMFPVLSPDEMAGHYQENEISTAVRRGRITGPGGAWDLIAQRVAAIPAYADAFDALDPGQPITFTAISDAIAAFIAVEWRADNSAFDAHLRGQAPLTGAAALGMDLFYGKAACSTCHAGQFQTDHQFHALAMPQIGPGKAERFEDHANDTGRMRVTGRAADAYAFRTPSLRNVTRTAPYGHAGAYATLTDVITHHMDPAGSLQSFDPKTVSLPDLPGADDFRVSRDARETAAILDAANPVTPTLTAQEIAALIAFLTALEDPVSLSGRLGVPNSVPSGLPVIR